MRRLAIIHPDSAKQALVRGLEERWIPQLGDGFGVPVRSPRREERARARQCSTAPGGRGTSDGGRIREQREERISGHDEP